MSSDRKTYIHTEQLPDSSSIMIIGEKFPAIVDSLEQYLIASSDAIYTAYDAEKSVQYLIVFDEPDRIKSYVSVLKKGGKLLHVISRKGYALKDDSVQTFYLSPKKEYPPKQLVRLLITKLAEAEPYAPSEPGTVQPSAHTSPFSIGPVKRYAIASAGILLLLLSPVIVAATACVFAVQQLQQITRKEYTIEDRITYAERAVTAAEIARTSYRAIHPVMSMIVPETDHILASHVDILTGSAKTAVIALEHYPVFASAQDTLKNAQANRIKSDMQDMKHALQAIQATLEPVASTITSLDPYAEHPLVSPVWDRYETITHANRTIYSAYSIIDYVPDLLAVTTRKTYAVLLQNNFELRPTGGFIGSYALVTVENGTIKNVSIEDVYEADGQLKGQVEPPDAIAQYLNQPNWFLRDSNWNPDFSLSAKQAEWFINKELNTHIDGVIAVDLYTLKYVLEALDGVYVPNYQATVTADDFFYKLQHDNHDDFFPGSDKKKNLLTDLTTALSIDLGSRDSIDILKVAQAIEQSLHEKHILVYHQDQTSQQLFESLGWAGRIVSPPTDVLGATNTIQTDYNMVVDANVGVNKVNASISRELFTSIELLPNYIEHELVVYYKNNSSGPEDTLYNGTYKNFMRVIIPLEADISSVTDKTGADLLTTAQIETLQDKKTIGLYVVIPPRFDEKIIVRYQLPRPEQPFTYELMTQKQPGTDADPLVIKLGPRAAQEYKRTSFETVPYLTHLTTDQVIAIDF